MIFALAAAVGWGLSDFLGAVSTRRVGLLCALARPERVIRFLARRGITPLAVVRAADHGPFPPAVLDRARARARSARLDVWHATSKCALHLPQDADRELGAPLEVLDHTLALDPALVARLRALVAA